MYKASKKKRYRLPLMGALMTIGILLYPNRPVALPANGDTNVTVTTAVSTTTTTLVPSEIMAKWNKVAWCETHGHWWRNMPTFDGGLGISRVNWQYYAPASFPDAPHLASPQQQVYVARIIQHAGGAGEYVPDQNGTCGRW